MDYCYKSVIEECMNHRHPEQVVLQFYSVTLGINRYWMYFKELLFQNMLGMNT